MARRRRAATRIRRPMEWFYETVDFNAIGNGGQVSQLVAAGMAADLKKGSTIVRWIVDLSYVMVVASSGGVLTFALSHVEEDARLAGVLGDADVDLEMPGWIWRANRVISGLGTNDFAQRGHISVDLRTARKFLGEEDNFILQVEYNGVDSVNIDGYVRTLVMKH